MPLLWEAHEHFIGAANGLAEGIRAEVARRGYCLLRVWPGDGEEALTALANALGRPKKSLRHEGIIDRLISTAGEEAYPNTLSSRFGLGAFPLHTDDAVAHRPSRFILLFNAEGGELADTTFLDLAAIFKQLTIELQDEATEAVFYFRNGRQSFAASLFDRTSGFNRFDPNIMRPSGERARRVLHAITQLMAPMPLGQIAWQAGTLAVLDNHRLIHGRTPLATVAESPKRVLLRVLVEE
jgi:hypothetical protein